MGTLKVAEIRSDRVFRFGPFEADFVAGELRKHGTRLKLSGQPLEILKLLLETRGQIVTREQIRERLWPENTFVDFDHGLNAAVNKLRESLGDSADSPTYIQTVPRRGYRFIGEVEGPKVGLVPASSVEAVPGPVHRSPRTWLVLGSLALIVVASVFLFLASKRRIPLATPPSRVTLAVLPFENLSGNPAQDHFSYGITEELSTQLARLNPDSLGVIARMTSDRYRNSTKSVTEIGQELGVQYVVEGSVRQADERVRITAQLIRTSDQTHIWAANFDRDLRDILALQTEVATAVAREVGVKIAAFPRQKRQIDPEVLSSHFTSKLLLSRNGYEEAAKFLEKLKDTKGDDPDVWSALAMSYFNLAGRIVPQKETIARAESAAAYALKLDPDSPRALSVNGMLQFHYYAKPKVAEEFHRRALQSDPSDVRSHFSYALMLSALGRVSEVEQQLAEIRALEPFADLFACPEIRARYYIGQSQRIVAQYAADFDKDSVKHLQCYWFTLAALQQNRHAGLDAAADKLATSSDLQEHKSVAGYVYARLGQHEKALGMLRDLQQRRRRGQFISSYNLAVIYTGLGQYDEAIKQLEASADEPTGMLVYLNADPIWAPLRSNPRFIALMRRNGLPV